MPRPEDAVLDPELEPVLREIADRVGWLAVISGRERSVLAGRLPHGWLVLGSYGLELPPSISATGFPPGFDPEDAEARLADARIKLHELSRTLPGTVVEAKRLGLALHFRAVPEIAADREVWRHFRALALGSGLKAVEGRLVYEMSPAAAVDKGWAIGHLIERLSPSAATFAGDDLGDVLAWDRLRRISGQLPTLAVGVGSEEAPTVMADVCDVVLPDRSHLREYCEELLQRATAAPAAGGRG